MRTERLIFLSMFGLFFLAAHLGAGTVFMLPPGTGSQVVSVYNQEPFQLLPSFNIPANTTAMFVNPAGTKIYSVTDSATDAIVVTAANSSNVLKRISLGLGITSAAMTPDGRKLVTLAGTVRVFDTSTDSEVSPANGIDVGASPTEILVSLDSTRAFVLNPSAQTLTAVDLASNTVAGTPLAIPSQPNTMAMAPNGLIYISAFNRVFEVDPRAMTIRGEIVLTGRPGKALFTPDGTRAVAVNTTATTGTIFFVFDLAARSVAGSLPYQFSVTLDKLLMGGNDRLFAMSFDTKKLYKITLNPLILDYATFLETGNVGALSSFVLTDEAPRPAQLFMVDQANLYRLDMLTDRATNKQPLTAPSAPLMFYGVTQGVAGTILPYGGNQTVAPGGTSAPLVARVLNANGKPLYNVPVSFSTTAAGATIVGAMAATNVDGYALAYVTVPSTTGSITVNARAGDTNPVTMAYTVNIGTGPGPGPGPGSTQIQKVSGDGQIAGENRQTDLPLRVIVRDASGNPAPNVRVNWSIDGGMGNLSNYTSDTDADGIAETFFVGFQIIQGYSYSQQTVTATAPQGSVSFITTTVLTFLSSGGYAQLPILELLTPQAAVGLVTGKLGQTVKGGIQVRISVASGPQTGFPLPNVGLFLTSTQDPTTGPVPACAGGTALSDTNGLATCDVVISGRQGDSRFFAKVGGNTGWELRLSATPGDPGAIRIIQGDGQSGNAGQVLPLALVGEVSDGYGNKIPGADVTWEVVTPGSLTLTEKVEKADAQARVSARVTLGATGGAHQVRVRSKTGSALGVFTVTVNVIVSALNKISGDNQSALLNQAFSLPVKVQVVDAKPAGLANIPVAFAVTSGAATLGAPSATTDAQGFASVTVRAGATPGGIVIRASMGAFAVTFNLSSRLPGPAVTAAGFVNGAGYQPGVVPGGIVTIYGQGLAPGISGSVTPGTILGALPTKLAGVEVIFGATAAPIYNVSNINGLESVTVQAPFELGAPGTTTVTVRVSGGSTVVNGVPTVPLQPGLFETVDASGARYAVAIGDDGRYIMAGSGARSGEIVRVLLTSLGQTIPGTGTNRAGVPGQTVFASLVVGVNNEGVRLVSAEYMVGVVGVYIVAFEVPAGTQSGPKRPLVVAAISADGSTLIYSNPSTIAIQ